MIHLVNSNGASESFVAHKIAARWLWPSLLLLLLNACDHADRQAQVTPPSNKETASEPTASKSPSLPAENISSDDTTNPTALNANVAASASSSNVLTDDPTSRQPVPMIAEYASANNLGATLIGDYSGILPCEDGDKVEVELNLFADGMALKTTHHQSTSHQPPIPTQQGPYQQANNIITIKFDNATPERYLINDNQLLFLSNELPISEQPADNFTNAKYILSRN